MGEGGEYDLPYSTVNEKRLLVCHCVCVRVSSVTTVQMSVQKITGLQFEERRDSSRGKRRQNCGLAYL